MERHQRRSPCGGNRMVCLICNDAWLCGFSWLTFSLQGNSWLWAGAMASCA